MRQKRLLAIIIYIKKLFIKKVTFIIDKNFYG